MRDDDLRFVERIHRELNDIRWPEPAELRARARRRSRRTALAAAALVVVTMSAAALVAGRSATPVIPATHPPEPAPVRHEIVQEALLQPADLGVEADPTLTEAGIGAPVRIPDMLPVCLTAQGERVSWETSRYSRSMTLLKHRPAGDGRPPSDLLLNQDVYRLAPEVAERFFRGVGSMLAPCATWRSTGPAEWGGQVVQAEMVHRWEAVDRDFTGDEALLVRHTISRARNLRTGAVFGPTPKPTSLAVVRVGDLVTVLSQGRDGTEPELRRLATVAARRLCAAANPSC